MKTLLCPCIFRVSYTGDKEKASKWKYYAIRTLGRVGEEIVLNRDGSGHSARGKVCCSWQVLCVWFKNVLADGHRTSKCQLLECIEYRIYGW